MLEQPLPHTARITFSLRQRLKHELGESGWQPRAEARRTEIIRHDRNVPGVVERSEVVRVAATAAAGVSIMSVNPLAPRESKHSLALHFLSISRFMPVRSCHFPRQPTDVRVEIVKKPDDLDMA